MTMFCIVLPGAVRWHATDRYYAFEDALTSGIFQRYAGASIYRTRFNFSAGEWEPAGLVARRAA